SRAAERARRGDGPTLLEFETFRMRGHEEASGTAYVPKHLFVEWAAKDPVVRFEAMLHERGVLRAGDIDRMRAALKVMIDALVDEALEAPLPESTAEREIADVFAASPPVPPSPDPGPASEMRYVDAIRDGLREALRLHPKLVVMGQDIAEYGGVFKVTEGFLEEFGRARIRNTPIIES